MPTPQTSVIRFDSTDAGAPTLNNVNGSMIAVLDACLKDGYNLKTITSLVVAAGVATATCAGHGYPDDSIEEISGATPAALNGRKRITVVNANVFTFDATGVADGAAAGTITVKRAPLGWTKPFSSGTTKAVYARSDPAASTMLLRIDDTGAAPAAKNCVRAVMYESMVDVDTGVNPSPRATTLPGGQYWPKGYESAAAKRWILIGDSKTFYLFLDSNNSFSSNGFFIAAGFGDIRSYRAADPYRAFIGGSIDNNNFSSAFLPASTSLGSTPGTSGSCQLARLSNGIGGAVSFAMIGRGNSNFGNSSCPVYPSPVDNGCVIVPMVLLSESNPGFYNPLRGELRGIGEPMANIMTTLSGTTLTALNGSDRSWLILALGTSSNTSSASGSVAIDVTGPWI